MGNMITLTKKEYIKLLVNKEQIIRLKNSNVEEWEFYDECMNPDNNYDIGEYEDMITERITNYGLYNTY